MIQELNFPIENVLRHKDIAPKRKVDIDDSFWNENFSSFRDFLEFAYDTKDER